MNRNLKEIISSLKTLAISYEAHFKGKRDLGITGELGELMVCEKYRLSINDNPREEGYDAIDKEGKRVQIKCIRKGGGNLQKSKTGRISTFSKHEFDYCLVALFDEKYEINEIYKIDYYQIEEYLKDKTRRNPNAASILNKKRSERIFLNS